MTSWGLPKPQKSNGVDRLRQANPTRCPLNRSLPATYKPPHRDVNMEDGPSHRTFHANPTVLPRRLKIRFARNVRSVLCESGPAISQRLTPWMLVAAARSVSVASDHSAAGRGGSWFCGRLRPADQRLLCKLRFFFAFLRKTVIRLPRPSVRTHTGRGQKRTAARPATREALDG